MAVYVTEEELREEINILQKSLRLRYLYELLEDPNLSNIDDTKYNTIYKIPKEEQNDLLVISTTLIKEEISELEQAGYIKNYSKEKFGEMILKIVIKLAKRGNFAGYTWKEDFYSNALEKILSYAIVNIDLNMISPRTNLPVKVFAYITQIANNAFVEVINKRKEEQTMMMERIIPFEEFYEHVKQY